MKKLWSTFLKDAKLSLGGLYFYVELGLAAIFILVMVFVVPENFDRSQNFAVYLDLPAEARAMFADRLGLEGEAMIHESEEALRQAMTADRTSLGVIIRQREGRFVYEMVLQGFESEKQQDMMRALIEGGLLSTLPGFESVALTRTLGQQAERLTDRANILPIYLTMNVAMMGLFIIAAYIFLDKDEGVIRAYAVAPVRIWQYLASKMMIVALMGLITSIAVCLALVGLSINYLLLSALVLAFNLFGSALGLFIASFFDSMVKAMGAMYGGMMVLMVGNIAYLVPAFNPPWIRAFPTYPMLFSFRELLLQQGNLTYVYQSLGIFSALTVIVFALATWRFEKTLTA